MAKQSTGNVLAAICSFFIPGLGQLVQGRLFVAIVLFFLSIGLLPLFGLGVIFWIFAVLDAALWTRD